MSRNPLHRSHGADDLVVSEVTASEELESLRPDWTTLWSSATETTPFQTPQWLIPWWRHLGSGRLALLALRYAGRLVGVVPLSVQIDAQTGTPTVMLIGAGVSDYLGALFAPGFEQAGAQALLAWLTNNGDRWAVLSDRQLWPGSPLLETPAPPGCTDALAADEPCPALRFPSSPGPMEQVVPAAQATNLRYYTSRARKAGALAFEQATPQTAGTLLESLIRLHRQRWNRVGEAGVWLIPPSNGSHCSAIPGLLALGILRIYALHIANRVVAVYYGFLAGGRAYYYLGGFDPDWSAISPGTLLVGYAIENALLEGAGEFDFLLGRERYKYLWGARDRATYRRTLRRTECGVPE